MQIADFYPALEAFLLSLPGVTTDYKPEWDWKRFLLEGKQFAAFCGDDSDHALITMKCEPDFNDFVRQAHPGVIIPGYYCNKVHWNSVHPDGGVPAALVEEMCERGYRLVRGALPKRVQAQLPALEPKPEITEEA